MIPIEKVSASRSDVRKFGLLFAALAALAGVYALWKGSAAWVWLAGAAGLFLVSGLAAYPVLRPVYIGWMMFAQVLAWVNTRILLALFFYLVITPAGLVMRLLRKDPMHRRPDARSATYWVKRAPEEFDPNRYENLF